MADSEAGLRGQKINNSEVMSLFSIPQKVDHIVGVTPIVLVKPANVSQLHVLCDRYAFRLRPGAFNAATFTAATTDILTVNNHGYENAAGPFYLTTTTTLPAGLALATPYWIMKLDPNTFKLASSEANAIAEIAVDITTTGTGTHTIDGMPALEMPTVTTINGQGTLYLVEGQSVPLNAPSKVTVKGYNSAAVLTYWWV
jgi:hypothetical protein